MSVFQPPQYSGSYNSNMPMQPNGGGNQAPPSPVKGLGYVSDRGGPGTGSASGLNGYVGEKPAIREEPQNPQSLRRHTNLASPDPALSQTAFTQSQFTTNISAAAVQSQAMRNNTAGQAATTNEESPSAVSDLRRDRLRQYKQNTGNGGGGGSCGFTPHPSFNNRTRPPVTTQRPVNSRGPRDSANQINTTFQNSPNNIISHTAQNATSSPSITTVTSTPTTIVAYTLSDSGSMYKTFSGSTTWVRVMHIIVPDGKIAKRVHVGCMMIPTAAPGDDSDNALEGSNNNASKGTYGLRLVNSAGATLFARYDCDNTENFQVYTLDLSTTTNNNPSSAAGLIELQAQNGTGAPLLFSSAIIEF